MRRHIPAGQRTLLAVAVAALVGAAGCQTPAPGPAMVSAGSLFDGAETKADLVHQLATRPAQCLPLAPETEVCEWRVDAGSPRYPELSAALGSADPIAVICVLSARAAPLQPDACSLHPRRSNRAEFTVASHAQAEATTKAHRQIQGADTLLEMSRLLGQLPERCIVERNGGARRCEWTLSKTSYGHGTVARAVGASRSQKVSWTCRFPIEGYARPSGSCEGEPL